MLDANTSMGVGEIGLDRLKGKVISQAQKEVFVAQLELAAEMSRPVVLHGAKCWGEVVKSIRQYVEKIPAFLFHGFSRSDGLIPDIVSVNGFIGVGKSILNDHAINYRNLLKKVPKDRLLIETDSIGSSDEERSTVLSQILAKTYELTSVTELQIKANTELFLKSVT
jgi:TatD DNase family protein